MATSSIGKPIIIKTEEEREIIKKVLNSEAKPVFSPQPDINIAGWSVNPGLHRADGYISEIPYKLPKKQDECSHPLYLIENWMEKYGKCVLCDKEIEYDKNLFAKLYEDKRLIAKKEEDEYVPIAYGKTLYDLNLWCKSLCRDLEKTNEGKGYSIEDIWEYFCEDHEHIEEKVQMVKRKTIGTIK